MDKKKKKTRHTKRVQHVCTGSSTATRPNSFPHSAPNGGLTPPRTGMFRMMPRVPATLLFGSNHGSVRRRPTDSSDATAEARHTHGSEVVQHYTKSIRVHDQCERAVGVPGKVAGSAVYEAGTPWLLSRFCFS